MKVLFTQFIAEMGDKTQLMLVAMTSKFKLKDILLGTGVAILVLNGLAVLAGGLVSTVVPTWLILSLIHIFTGIRERLSADLFQFFWRIFFCQFQ